MTYPQVSTPVNVNNLMLELYNHPDQKFVHYLCEGFSFGFDTMISNTQLETLECKNSLSARTQPEIVDKLV